MNRRTLKIIALVSMTIDHIGMILFPDIEILRIIGRIAFPVFSYFISEGCRYSSGRLKYISLMAACEAVCLIGYFVEMRRIYFSIMMTFIISVLVIWAWDISVKMFRKGGINSVSAAAGFGLCVFAVWYICGRFDIMYGFFGCMMPLFAYIPKNRMLSVASFSAAVYLQALTSSGVQMYALMAVPLILLYDGKKMRSSKFEKYFYYVYYPLHIAAIYLVGGIV